MPKKEKYRCLNCGERFKVDLYSPDEKRDAQREGFSSPGSAVLRAAAAIIGKGGIRVPQPASITI